jgi:hypothetical protein
MFASTARNHCFRNTRRILSYVQMREAPYDNRILSICYRMCTQCGVFEIRSEHIDIDAASFGIIERSEAGILRSCMFTLFPSITFEFKVLRSL